MNPFYDLQRPEFSLGIHSISTGQDRRSGRPSVSALEQWSITRGQWENPDENCIARARDNILAHEQGDRGRL